MTTCRDIISLGLQFARVTALGREPKAAEADAGLVVLQGMYDGWFSGHLFDRWADVYADADYTAEEGDRITAETGVTVTLPDTVEDADTGETRAVKELAAVVVIQDGLVTNSVYSGGAWQTCSSLGLSNDAPLANRNAGGLAALFAMRFAETFGGQIGPAAMDNGRRFLAALMQKDIGAQAEYF